MRLKQLLILAALLLSCPTHARKGSHKMVVNVEYTTPAHAFELFRIDRDFNEQYTAFYH